MAKYRYLIEKGILAAEGTPYYLGTVDAEGAMQGFGSDHATVDEAKARAQEMARTETDDDGDPIVLVWKDPPQTWQPDAICVSQYLTPMYPDLPT